MQIWGRQAKLKMVKALRKLRCEEAAMIWTADGDLETTKSDDGEVAQ